MTETPVMRPATAGDREAVWSIIGPILRDGETYALDRDIGKTDALAYWLGGDRSTFVAELAGAIVGTYYLKRNQAGGGSHIANCGYAVSQAARGRGIARAMARHSLAEAKARGFRAMQYNFVVATNLGAIHLWESLGFRTLTRLPNAFDHPREGLVDACVMWREL
ncbi:GNAT family N-acetyltransferase [Fulvimarina sp. 2208YS6-2-32]|uniref:GNAT family N-acetyltransferase n=1 Tax=Fulvimarina uroteuthidis TaxID=3098149 RepID=A0ABU5I1E4_9HYPH|nr:GNAT family N-acetyltransferase [Fulvimarina sp. 2208YS6-2-32]MDY8109202.1 GNAT family N-acetyltransferase [Fulvimarina sp. 2208YS6-2-32]